MAQAREKGRSVFIGNIPYGVSEEQIKDIFGRVGQVVGFRLVYDKETHRPKGFGFLEYTNTDDSASAVRNLNDFEIMGRHLKVDYSNDNGTGASVVPPTAGRPGTNGVDAAALPRLPDGAEIPTGLTVPDAISKTLQTIAAPQLLDILSQMKNLVNNNPAQATALLATAPQLSYAIFQALLLLGLVDPSVLTALLQQSAQGAPAPAQVPQTVSTGPYPQSTYGQPGPTQFGPPSQSFSAPTQLPYTATPPAPHSAYQPPAQPVAPQVDPAQQALISQVLSMTRADIMALEEIPRNQILALRAQLGAPAL